MLFEGVLNASKSQPLFVQAAGNPESKFSQYGAAVHVNIQEPSSVFAKAL